MLYKKIVSELPWNFIAVADENMLYCLDIYPSNLADSFNAEFGNNAILEQCENFLDCYFQGETLPKIPNLAPASTDFSQAVRDAVLKILPGQRISYKELAAQLAPKERAVVICRALVHALHLNPFLLMVPCHRVVKSSGQPGAYKAGADLKVFLLDFERRHPKLAG